MIEMAGYISLYIREGFVSHRGNVVATDSSSDTMAIGDLSGTMATVFSQLISITPSTKKASSSGAKRTDGSCGSSIRPFEMAADTKDGRPTSFLKTLLEQQQLNAETLMNSAKNIAPVAQTMIQYQVANDAAFESETVSHSRIGGTFQGFILFFFIISYCILAIVTTFMVNAISGGRSAAGAFAGFFILSIILLAILLRVA